MTAIRLDMDYRILIIVDTLEDRLLRPSLEVISFGRACAAPDRGNLLLVVPGRDIRPLAAECARRFHLDTLALEHDDLYHPNPEVLWRCLAELVREGPPDLVCLQHTMRNNQAAAALAVATGTACITAVESFSRSQGGPTWTRSAFNGKLLQSIQSLGGPAVLTVQAGAYPAPVEAPGAAAEEPRLYHRACRDAAPGYRPVALAEQLGTERNRLEEADVIVAAGRGIGHPGNLDLLRAVAALFPNAAIGASRPVCDLDWLPYDRQVGITGRTVAPRLYMACGISGSQQHLAGMRGSQWVVSINRDPNAAICGASDVIVVEDLTTFLPLLVRMHQQKFSAL